ncbi:carnitine O-palmitoyltransferase 1, liver isoform-like [Schistocerca cancellata]|uniref:carnitine O-palmitoyltransferase 1, liver isoform-like n=1 Tax=Schistocerca cancellata TaxID=274614 RepID=UPI002118FE51|nr:carnitine O-palmitoyltransferase 1, liver isoform-like [Schistocerca cancellata]
MSSGGCSIDKSMRTLTRDAMVGGRRRRVYTSDELRRLAFAGRCCRGEVQRTRISARRFSPFSGSLYLVFTAAVEMTYSYSSVSAEEQKPVSYSFSRFFKRQCNKLRRAAYPVPLQTSIAAVGVFTGLHYYNYGPVPKIVSHIAVKISGVQKGWQILCSEAAVCTVLGVGSWSVLVLALRYTLKALFTYKGWMYEEGGRGRSVSLATKLWLLSVKVLTFATKPSLYSYQGVLPRLPVPPLNETIEKYLQSVRPIYDNERFDKVQNLATEFKNGIGRKFQRYLVFKSWTSDNYVTDWWQEFIYLRGRSPLVVNSNYYCIDTILLNHTNLQSARAATAIHNFLQFRKQIDDETLQPIIIQGLIPLCSWQYSRIFNTTRIPGDEADVTMHYKDSDHIVVYHKGRYFKVIVCYHGRILKSCEIEQQLMQILNDQSSPSAGEEKLAALTAGDRTHWSKTRKRYFSDGVNKCSLDTIEKAAFVVSLDEEPLEYDKEDPSKLDKFACSLLHGKGYDRWFDKSITLCVGSNGHMGFNAEHSGADGAVMAHTWEYVLQDELIPDHQCYTADGHAYGTPEVTPPAPIRLQWDLKPDCIEAIDTSYKVVSELISDLDMHLLVHDAYGKGFIKECRLSPDAFIQMAIQLAYYRDIGKFTLTYEASMTRLYLKGRTETVRSCTTESVEWVKSMMNPNSSVEEQVSKLQRACTVHTKGFKDSMCGKGIDRHLFCLYVLSKYFQTDSPFLNEALGEPWRLSTSQTPHTQIAKVDPRKNPKAITPAGGFGPTHKDGYGVSYIIAGEDVIFFHISSNHSSSQTDSKRFAAAIQTSMNDMKNLFLEWKEREKRVDPKAVNPE